MAWGDESEESAGLLQEGEAGDAALVDEEEVEVEDEDGDEVDDEELEEEELDEELEFAEEEETGEEELLEPEPLYFPAPVPVHVPAPAYHYYGYNHYPLPLPAPPPRSPAPTPARRGAPLLSPRLPTPLLRLTASNADQREPPRVLLGHMPKILFSQIFEEFHLSNPFVNVIESSSRSLYSTKSIRKRMKCEAGFLPMSNLCG